MRIFTSWPIKVLLSYLLVLGVSAIPIYYHLAVRLQASEALRTEAILVARYALAGGLSVALLLTLLSVYVHVRPIRRLRRVARELGDGELNPRFPKATNDEVGDVVTALEHMALHIRRRLADAGAATGILRQLLETCPSGIALFEEQADGTYLPLSSNGAAREALGNKAPKNVPSNSVSFNVDIGGSLLPAARISRPGQLPLLAVFTPPLPPLTGAAAAEEIVVQPLSEWVEGIRGEIGTDATWRGVVDVNVVDIEHASHDLVVALLQRQPSTVVIDARATSIRLRVDRCNNGGEVRRACAVFRDLGGRVVFGEDEVKLWLSRA